MLVANPSKFKLIFVGLNRDEKLRLETDEKLVSALIELKFWGYK